MQTKWEPQNLLHYRQYTAVYCFTVQHTTQNEIPTFCPFSLAVQGETERERQILSWSSISVVVAAMLLNVYKVVLTFKNPIYPNVI